MIGDHRGLIAAAALVTGAAGALAFQRDLVAAYPTMLIGLGVLTVGWIWGMRCAGDRAARAEVGAGSAPTRPRSSGVWLVVIVSLVARLALTIPPVPLSDDLHRYLWDGRVGNAGINPFLHAPSSDELTALRDDEVWPGINHPEVPTIYPATAQLYFRALDLLGGSLKSPRIAAAFLDTLTVWLLAGMLVRRRRPAVAALAYGWCPLAILESGGGGHVDVLGITLLVAALALADRVRGRALPVGLALGLSTLVKPMAPLILPAVLRGRSWRAILLLGLGGGLALAIAIPDLDAGARMLTGFQTYARHWQFNDAIYSRIADTGADPAITRWVLVLATGVAAWVVAFTVRDPLAAAGIAVAIALLLSPTVHPWYVTWLAALLVWAPRSARRAFTLFVALAPVSYVSAWVLSRTGEWREPDWLWYVSWVIPAALLVLDRVRARRASGVPAAASAVPGDESASS